MIVRLNKDEANMWRQRLMLGSGDIVFITFNRCLKQLHSEGATALTPPEVFLSAKRLAATLLTMDEVDEAVDDEVDNLADEASSIAGANGDDEAMIISVVAAAIVTVLAKSHSAEPIYQEIARALIMRCSGHPLFYPMMSAAGKKEEERLNAGKRANLMAYELESAALEGEEAVRKTVANLIDIAKTIDPDATKNMLLVLSRFNDCHGHKYQDEVDRLYNIHRNMTASMNLQLSADGQPCLNFNNRVGQVVAKADVVNRF